MRHTRYIRMIICTLLLAGLLICSPAQAITVTVDPVAQDVSLGNQAIVDVIIYGYAPGGGVNVAIGAFDFDIDYDPSILGFASLAFGSSLGNPTTEAITSFFNNGGAGVLNITEVSLLTHSALYATQGQAWPDDSFIAATLTFNALGSGTSPLVIEINAMPNEMGLPFPDYYADPGSINVKAVPEPATMLLLGIGLMGLAGVRRFKK